MATKTTGSIYGLSEPTAVDPIPKVASRPAGSHRGHQVRRLTVAHDWLSAGTRYIDCGQSSRWDGAPQQDIVIL